MRPVVDIVRPAALAGLENGKLPGWALTEIAPGLLLEHSAAESWRRLVDAAKADGVTLTADWAYRDYATQVSIFKARYTQEWSNTKPVYWDGNPWWKLPNAVTAAVPATSNHGWGLAVDIHTDATNVPWLEQHEVEHGWSHEAGISETEPWHIHYFAGDQPEQPPEPLPEEVDMIRLVVTDDPAGAELVLGAGTICWIASGDLPPIYDFARVPVANVTVAQVHDILITHDKIGQAPNAGALLGAW